MSSSLRGIIEIDCLGDGEEIPRHEKKNYDISWNIYIACFHVVYAISLLAKRVLNKYYGFSLFIKFVMNMHVFSKTYNQKLERESKMECYQVEYVEATCTEVLV